MLSNRWNIFLLVMTGRNRFAWPENMSENKTKTKTTEWKLLQMLM